jgi:hypothetical protein
MFNMNWLVFITKYNVSPKLKIHNVIDQNQVRSKLNEYIFLKVT